MQWLKVSMMVRSSGYTYCIKNIPRSIKTIESIRWALFLKNKQHCVSSPESADKWMQQLSRLLHITKNDHCISCHFFMVICIVVISWSTASESPWTVGSIPNDVRRRWSEQKIKVLKKQISFTVSNLYFNNASQQRDQVAKNICSIFWLLLQSKHSPKSI